jgi:hypothetical protein
MITDDSEPVGTAHMKPLLDSCKYEVEYADGYVEELTADLIAKNIIVQVGEEPDDVPGYHGSSWFTRYHPQESGDFYESIWD